MQFVDRIKGAMTMDGQQQKSMLGQIDEAVTLSWKSRLIGFGCCIAFGLILTIVSIPMMWTGSITQFAIFYSLGTITSILSTIFLMGPIKQMQRMFEQNRIIATIIMLIAITLTLVFAFKLRNAGVCMIMIVVQFCALTWYCLTWIPGGTAAVKALVFRSG
uniref:Vesicle transport protein n=1 Tax=Chlamydomonas leiostraca TaxID=1034604 RepID=A0A7S0S206_9CHLO|mmetsp:Transcript_4651/g.11490  ORF Transcript_4651/g.11490 Transcript_4651/m.11490 type:complete len:161 (+) Transcript_4651:49-531(+)